MHTSVVRNVIIENRLRRFCPRFPQLNLASFRPSPTPASTSRRFQHSTPAEFAEIRIATIFNFC